MHSLLSPSAPRSVLGQFSPVAPVQSDVNQCPASSTGDGSARCPQLPLIAPYPSPGTDHPGAIQCPNPWAAPSAVREEPFPGWGLWSPPQEQPDTLSRGADKAGGGPGSCSCPHLTPGVRRLYLGTPQPAVRSPLGHSAGHTFSGRQTAAPPAPCAAPRPGLHTAVPLPAHRLNSAAATRGPGLSSGQGLGGTEPQGTKRGAGSSPRPGHTQPCGTATI